MDYRIEKDVKREINYKGYNLPKYFILSGVSNSLGSFMSFMNKYFNTKIKYANFSTNLHLELYLEKKENETITENDYRIEYYYNDEFLLSIPYFEFKNKIKNELLDKSKVEAFCKEEENKEDDISINWYMMGTVITIFIIIILVILIIILLKRRVKMNNINNCNFKKKG